jgi:hypothetical protein
MTSRAALRRASAEACSAGIVVDVIMNLIWVVWVFSCPLVRCFVSEVDALHVFTLGGCPSQYHMVCAGP